uniref:Uncharacterized protein n=1 Tax=Tetraselmis sp. GSL018 TaxID=582737 RepID=A0A061SIX5_9CHLO
MKIQLWTACISSGKPKAVGKKTRHERHADKLNVRTASQEISPLKSHIVSHTCISGEKKNPHRDSHLCLFTGSPQWMAVVSAACA